MRKILDYSGTNELKQNNFKQWCDKRGISFFGFDADDTLWETIPIFVKQMDKCFDYLSTELPVLSKQKWKERIELINNRLFETISVNPNRWKYVLDEALANIPLPEKTQIKALEILMKIYKTKPKIFKNTIKTIRFIKECGIGVGVITHANEKWHLNKMKWTGLDKVIDKSNAYVVDENGHKTAESWESALSSFGVSPINCVVVGDSPRSDIIPAREIGAKETILVRKPDAHRWSVQNAELNDNCYVVKHIGEIMNLRD